MSAEAIQALFNNLKPVQQDMFRDFLQYDNGRKYVIHCSRRLGKTYLLCTLAIVQAINRKDMQIRYASVTQKSVRNMIFPIMRELLALLSDSERGRWNSQAGAYLFPNGSSIHVAGVNNGHEDDLRGTSADLCIIDEAAFVDRLKYLVESVMIPQLITTEKGKLIMASSSPLSPAHEFASYIHASRLGNYYSSYDITQGNYAESTVQEFINESGGRDSTTTRREYFNELIVDSSMAVIPEWRREFAMALPHTKFRKYYLNYSSMDIGVRDKTIVLWAYYDFKQGLLSVEHEFDISGKDTTTRNIANGIIAIEKEDPTYAEVYKRVADNNNLVLLNDLSNEFGLHYGATTKESLAAMVNAVRLMVQDGRIRVNPRCKQLIGCLEYGVYYDEKRKEFGRSDEFGHYDALAALIYLVRNLDMHINTIPANYGHTVNTFVPQIEYVEPAQDIRRIFNT
jgi:hypothetical protein